MEKELIAVDAAKLKETLGLYDRLCTDASLIMSALEDVIPGFGVKDLFELLNTGNPEQWLIVRYAAYKQEEHPGLDTMKMIETGIIPLPFQVEETINDLSEIKDVLSQIKAAGFVFPLKKLYFEAEKCFSVFDGEGFVSELEDKAKEFYSTFAETKEQVEALQAVKQIAVGLNKLSAMGIFNWERAGVMPLGRIGEFFEVDRKNDYKLIVARRLFIKPTLKRFRTGNTLKQPAPLSRLFE